MKKIFILVILIFIPILSFAQFYFSTEVGYAIEGDYTPANHSCRYKHEYYDQPFYIVFSPEIDFFKYFTVYGSARINMYKTRDGVYFNPVSISSTIGIRVYFKGLSLSLEHNCKHGAGYKEVYDLPEQKEDEDYTQVSIKYTTRKIK